MWQFVRAVFPLPVWAVCSCLSAFLTVASFPLVAQGSLQGEGAAKEMMGIQSYPHAQQLYHSQSLDDDYRLVLGAFKKVNNVWRTDNEQRLAGQVIRQTLELPRDHSGDEVYQFYLSQLQTAGARELFSCRARDCGSSSSWANNHFKVKQLYGLDQYQRYGVYEITRVDNTRFYASLYVVQRGNKRVYLQLEILSPGAGNRSIASSSKTILQALESQGYYPLPEVTLVDGKLLIPNSHLKAVVTSLQKKRGLRVWVVGHDDATKVPEQALEQSRDYAEQVAQQLQAAGVSGQRLSSYGVGGLAPVAGGATGLRIVLVVAR